MKLINFNFINKFTYYLYFNQFNFIIPEIENAIYFKFQ